MPTVFVAINHNIYFSRYLSICTSCILYSIKKHHCVGFICFWPPPGFVLYLSFSFFLSPSFYNPDIKSGTLNLTLSVDGQWPVHPSTGSTETCLPDICVV